MKEIAKKLLSLQDVPYADFTAKLIPNVARENIIGVRLPQLRALAKELLNSPEAAAFLKALPHQFHEENMLHAVLLGFLRNMDEAVAAVERFLPYVDNWAVCDSLRPKAFANKGEALLPTLERWISSKNPYTVRFGLLMLMTHYLDGQFSPDLLEIPAAIRSEEYYVNMMVAWYFATALSKQWDAVIGYLEQHKLPEWTHRKTIQKAVESFRITPQQKAYLRSLK